MTTSSTVLLYCGQLEFDQWFILVGMKRAGLVGAPAGWTHFVNSCEVVNKREYFIHRVRYVNVTERGVPKYSVYCQG